MKSGLKADALSIINHHCRQHYKPVATFWCIIDETGVKVKSIIEPTLVKLSAAVISVQVSLLQTK